MQKDLESLAKEMQKLTTQQKNYWLRVIAGGHDLSFPTACYPSHLREERFQSTKKAIIWSLSGILAGKNVEELPVVRKGVDSFMFVSKEERDEFYKAVLPKETPSKIAVKSAHTSPRHKEERIHE
ncbi:MAG: hypothetical protein SPL08_02785 [Pseudomonadota bacterium]|nr:hypothetical protein [Pseudomonadota bacterium]